MSAINSRRNTVLRRCFTSRGKPKRRFSTQIEAQEFNKAQKSSLHAYECDCGHWHLGGGRRK